MPNMEGMMERRGDDDWGEGGQFINGVQFKWPRDCKWDHNFDANSCERVLWFIL